MNNIMVTGATGFIGSHLIYELINNEYNVAILCRKESKIDNFKNIINKIKVYKVDDNIDKIIMALNQFKPNCIVHLAAVFKSEHEKEDIDNFIDTNIKYPTKILEAMKQCGIKKFINTSTAWQHYNNEDYNPVCLYAATKESFEKIIDYYAKGVKFKCISLELFDSYGDNDTRGKLISILKDFSINNKTLKMTEGESKIDLTHVNDIVYGFIKAIEFLNDIEYGEHRKYAICTGRVLTLKEVIEIFEEKTGYKLNVEWGARHYREREIMKPWDRYEILPNWKSKITFEDGVTMI